MTEQNDEIIPVDDGKELASVVVQWHALKIARLRHMLKVPEGTEVEFGDGETLKLEGETHSAYRLGIQVALSELSQLPFVAEFDTDD